MELNERTSLLIFAGAGASKAVNPKYYPTTVEFFDRLPDEVRGDSLFSATVEWLRRQNGEESVLDIELVLWALEELQAFTRPVRDRASVAGWFLRERLGGVLSTNQNYQNIIQAADQLEGRIETVVSRINRQVYGLYGRAPKPEELKVNWLQLFTGLLRGHRRAVDIFTTNYDVNIEVALSEFARRDIGNQRIDTGRSEDSPAWATLDLKAWSEDRGEASGVVGLLTKLHGSVHWSRNGDEIYISDPLYKGSEEKHVILYPGFKGVPDREPFTVFHEYLKRSLGKASLVLFIGFAFRDEHIQELLAEYTRRDAVVVVLDPAEALAWPYEAERVVHIKRPFDKTGVADVVSQLESVE